MSSFTHHPPRDWPHPLFFLSSLLFSPTPVSTSFFSSSKYLMPHSAPLSVSVFILFLFIPFIPQATCLLPAWTYITIHLSFTFIFISNHTFQPLSSPADNANKEYFILQKRAEQVDCLVIRAREYGRTGNNWLGRSQRKAQGNSSLK